MTITGHDFSASYGNRDYCRVCGEHQMIHAKRGTVTMRLGGVESDATRETRNWNIWSEAVILAAIRRGVPSDWFDQVVRQRLCRAYAAGEAVWMVADEMIQRYAGSRRAAREDADGRKAIRAALR